MDENEKHYREDQANKVVDYIIREFNLEDPNYSRIDIPKERFLEVLEAARRV